MRERVLEREQVVPTPIERAFDFYSDAGNLERITPPWLRFRMVTPAPIEMREGALLEYRLVLHGIPVRWRTRIESWEPPVRFVDAQLRGPYALWHHTHEFEPDGSGGTIMPLIGGDDERLGPSDPRVIAEYVSRPPTPPVPQIIAQDDGYQDNDFYGALATINADLGKPDDAATTALFAFLEKALN